MSAFRPLSRSLYNFQSMRLCFSIVTLPFLKPARLGVLNGTTGEGARMNGIFGRLLAVGCASHNYMLLSIESEDIAQSEQGPVSACPNVAIGNGGP